MATTVLRAHLVWKATLMPCTPASFDVISSQSYHGVSQRLYSTVSDISLESHS